MVYDDSFPFNHRSSGTQHDRVAAILLKGLADFTLRSFTLQYYSKLNLNLAEKTIPSFTPLDLANAHVPLLFEKWWGRRVISNTGSHTYYADKVRPLLEERVG